MTEQNTILGTEETPFIPPSSDDKTRAILAHILTLVCGFIAPLVIYLMGKDKADSAFSVAHAKESLNFQITLIICYIICVILAFVLIGFLLMALLGISALVLIIIATIRASEGKLYKYPFAIRLIK